MDGKIITKIGISAFILSTLLAIYFAPKQNDKNLKNYYQLGESYGRSKSYDRALQIYEEGQNKHPKSHLFKQGLASIYLYKNIIQMSI